MDNGILFIDTFFKPELIVRYLPDILKGMSVTIEITVLVVIAGVSIGVLEAVFGPKPATAVVVTDQLDPKLQRRFANVQEVADEVVAVRVWGGIHFRNSLEVGYSMGRKIADFLAENALKPAS